jgi:hypothetical protein
MASRILPVNEGAIDRSVRIVVGLVGVALGFVGPKTPWGWIGLLPLVTGLAGSCLLYTVFGWTTCPRKQA